MCLVNLASQSLYTSADYTRKPLSSTNISGDRALASRRSKMCDQKHGGFWPNIRHFDVTIDLFLW